MHRGRGSGPIGWLGDDVGIPIGTAETTRHEQKRTKGTDQVEKIAVHKKGLRGGRRESRLNNKRVI